MIDSAIECTEIGLKILRRTKYEHNSEKRMSMLIDAQRWIGKAIWAIGEEKDNVETKASDTCTSNDASTN